MFELKIIFLILAIHFVADFILQSDWMAQNKSKNIDALTFHVLTYGALFFCWSRCRPSNSLCMFILEF